MSDIDTIRAFLAADPSPCVVDCEVVFAAIERVTGWHVEYSALRWRLVDWRGVQHAAGKELTDVVRRAVEVRDAA